MYTGDVLKGSSRVAKGRHGRVREENLRSRAFCESGVDNGPLRPLVRQFELEFVERLVSMLATPGRDR